ncbi:hypothetical protein [Runella slithyformis]|uniref:hypothetical protein n=1 Tax=Runella slithyformis TaxID=106 RepID=UPI000315777D|nr:hypothetical protein [Runella slithyformis]
MKIFIKLIALSVLSVCFLSSFLPFTDKTYYWDDYNIEITVPSDFKIVKDTKNEFEMKGDGMELFMYIWNQKAISVDDIDDATIAAGKEMKLTEVDDEGKFENDDFAGYYVEGFKDGDRVIFAGVVDLKSRTNFFIAITFDDKDAEAEKEAINILESIDHKS